MTTGSMPMPCPEHGPPDAPDHRFCEECGRELERVPQDGVDGPLTGTTGGDTSDGVVGPAVPAPGGTGSAPGPAAPATGAMTGRSVSSGPATARWGAGAERDGHPHGGGTGGVAGTPDGSGVPVSRAGLETLAGPAVPGGLDSLAGPSASPDRAAPVAWSQPVVSAGPQSPAGPARPAPQAAHPGSGSPSSAAPAWLSSRAPGHPCPRCGAVPSGNPGHCERCGQRWNVGRDRADLDLGTVAAVTDRARRHRNEDAVAVGRLGGATAAVICDGVSTSLRADVAAHAAAESGLAAILSALAAGSGAAEAIVTGTRAAAAATRATAVADDGQVPPSCTYVAAVVTADSVAVGWIGDSRAYWLGPDGATDEAACLTVDDSVVGRIRAGRPVPPGAELHPTSRALVRWLGADSTDTEPEVVAFQPTRAGRLVLCTDGLSHYLPDPASLAVRVPGPTGATPLAIARDLTGFAVASGGHDNVAVAVLPFPPVARQAGAHA